MVPVGDMTTSVLGARGDSLPDAGDGCRLWYVNSWRLAGPATSDKAALSRGVDAMPALCLQESSCESV